MSIKVEELIATPENNETLDCDGSVETPDESTKEIYRRETIADSDNSLLPSSKKPSTKIEKPKSSYTRPPSSAEAAAAAKKNSGIPKRLKQSNPNPAPLKQPVKPGSYRSPTGNVNTMGHVINKNTLEVQFMNNRKRMLQLHAEIQEKQRPLFDIHKSLVRTQKQLEGLGKKVVLEDLKIVSMNVEEDCCDGKKVEEGAGEINETVMKVKCSIDNVFETCVKVCQKCFLQRNDVVKMLENLSNVDDPADFECEVEDIVREKNELEKSVENAINENEKLIADLLENLKNAPQVQGLNEEMKEKIVELDAKIKQQQKILSESEENAISQNRKFEDKKVTLEKTIAEQQEKTAKLEEDLKKEKKNAVDSIMKSRSYRTKMTDLENKAKEAEEKSTELANKLKKLEDQMRKKEIQWVKEKDDFKKNEALLQQKFTEKQSQFDTRLNEMETLLKISEVKQKENYQHMETEMEIKDQELAQIEQEKIVLHHHSVHLEAQLEELRQQLEEKEKEVDELSIKKESVPAIEYHDEAEWAKLLDYQKKITDVQGTVKEQNEQINKMQSSLKAHAQLAVALKLEKDNAIRYAKKVREILQEARDEIEFKNKTIYKIHEKLVLNETAYEKLKNQMKEYDMFAQYNQQEHGHRTKCQICMHHLVGGEIRQQTDCLSNPETEGDTSSKSFSNNNNSSLLQQVSGSLIGMSVKKVDKLRARLDNLKKVTLVAHPKRKRFMNNKLKQSWSNQTCNTNMSDNKEHLQKEIQLRGKLYQILQKHADQSCEDFINLLKLTVSNSEQGSGLDELNPSNLEEVNYKKPKKFSSNIHITESVNTITEIIDSMPRHHRNIFTRKSVIFEDEDS